MMKYLINLHIYNNSSNKKIISEFLQMKQYQLCTATQNVQRQIQKLKSCISSHFLHGDPALKRIAQNHVALLG